MFIIDPFAVLETCAKLAPIGLLFVFLLCRFRGRPYRRRFRPSYGSLGNALQAIQSIAQPQVEYTLEEKLKQQTDEDDEGGPDDPVAYYRRKMKEVDNCGKDRPESRKPKHANRAD
jgi:hypothetical protein